MKIFDLGANLSSCGIKTLAGTPCKNDVELSGFCHIHDPEGAFQLGLSSSEDIKIPNSKSLIANWESRCSTCQRTIYPGDPFTSVNRQVLCSECTSSAKKLLSNVKVKKMNRKQRAIIASAVECPFCGASRGNHCFNPKNKVYRNWHPQRLEAGIARSRVEILVSKNSLHSSSC